MRPAPRSNTVQGFAWLTSTLRPRLLVPVLIAALLGANLWFSGAQAGNSAADRALQRLAQLSAAQVEPQATFDVNSNADSDDGACTSTPGGCTLREAIDDANANPGADAIGFSIGSGRQRIVVGGSTGLNGLPTITGPVIIDGTTQEGYTGTPLIELTVADPTLINGSGLTIAASESRVQGLIIDGFPGDGVTVSSGVSNTITLNSIFDNGGIGIDLAPNGVTANDDKDPDAGANNLQNFPVIVSAVFSGGNVVIGGSLNSTPDTTFTIDLYTNNDCDPADEREGEFFLGSVEATTGSDGNGSFNATFPNQGFGNQAVSATATDPAGNTSEFAACKPYTGPTPTPTEVVPTPTAINSSGATTLIVNSNGDNKDAGPNEGCDAANCTLREAITRVNTNTANPMTIRFDIRPGGRGGAQTINVLSSPLPAVTKPVTIDGTTQPGYNGAPIIELNGTGAGAGANGLFFTGGNSTVRGLVINRFSASGIVISNTGGLLIEGNFIGTDLSGGLDLGNGQHGILIDNEGSNTIGGITAAARNVISGNTQDGIRIVGSAATGNLIQGNFIGTNVTGSSALGNSGAGVRLTNAPTNTVGGLTVERRNIISGNTGSGVTMVGNVTGNLIQGNFIGTNVNGTSGVGNGDHGVSLTAAMSGAPMANTIGGTQSGARNVISDNDESGVLISGAGTQNNFVQGNFIGTNAAGNQALGNGSGGILIDGAPNNIVGGTAAGAGNVISGNTGSGVRIEDASATNNRVQGNLIGSDVNGTQDRGNSGSGVEIFNTSRNLIGGPTSAARNVILGNNGNGVTIAGSTLLSTTLNVVQGNAISASGTAQSAADGVFVSSGISNTIRQNLIFGNAGLGIDLGANGVTENDEQNQDADTGANGLQNFPILTAARSGSTVIQGTLISKPSTTYTLDFYSNIECDGSGRGEGQIYLGQATVTTNGSGTVTFNVTLPATASGNESVTATATDPAGNTSEFSNCQVVIGPTATPVPTVTNTPTNTATPTRTSTATRTSTSTAMSTTPTTGTSTTTTTAIAPTTGTAISPTSSGTPGVTGTPTTTTTTTAGTVTVTATTTTTSTPTPPVFRQYLPFVVQP